MSASTPRRRVVDNEGHEHVYPTTSAIEQVNLLNPGGVSNKGLQAGKVGPRSCCSASSRCSWWPSATGR